MRSRRHESGAAMVIAIAIMTILLAIALTFFIVSRTEVETATNVSNSVRADQLTNAAINIGIAHLNQDFFRHPNATSTDHGWRSLFNGAWVVGKPWALRGGVPLQNGGVPYIDLNRLPFQAIVNAGIPQPLMVKFIKDGYAERLYQGQRTKDWLYYPRVEMMDGRPVLYDPDTVLLDRNGQLVPEGLYFRYDKTVAVADLTSNRRHPSYFQFVTSDIYDIVRRGPQENAAPAFNLEPGSAEYDPARGGDNGAQYPAEQIDAWTDVDNDGDGLRDSIWVPIPADTFLPDDGVDNNLNGLIDEQQDNGINEDNDFCGDECADLQYMPNGSGGWVEDYYDEQKQNVKYDPDEAIEAGVFVYYGGDDGLDNDGDGLIDAADPDENGSEPNLGYFLTAPLPGIEIPVDFNADGVPGDLVPNDLGKLVPLKVILPQTITVSLAGGRTVQLTEANVDRLDNDFDMVINNYSAYAYVGPNTMSGPPFVLSGFDRNEPNIGAPIRDYTKDNSSVLTAGAALGDFYGDTWRLPGNWFVPTVPNVLKDEDLFAVARSKSYVDINLESLLRGSSGLRFEPATGVYTNPVTGTEQFNYATMIGPYIRITHSGEPVCELVGRAAILINDEAGKVNVNVAGAHQFPEENLLADWTYPDNLKYKDDHETRKWPLFRALVQGLSPHEVETRVLPATGTAISRKLYALLMGAPGGETNPNNGHGEYKIQASNALDEIAYRYDAALPGYGRVDDNGNALLLAMNGLDDDGDGMIDEGLNPAYPKLLGRFEGIDEPAEAQWFRPLRNELAERDGVDNDKDDVTDEIGELGDRVLQNIDQISALYDFAGPGTTAYERIRRLITAYSTDRNVDYVETAKGLRAMSRLDFNYATPQQIAAAMMINGTLQPSTADANFRFDEFFPTYTDNVGEAREFAEGLRQADTHFSAPRFEVNGKTYGGFLHLDIGAIEPASFGLPADPQLQAMQAAVNLADARDADAARSTMTTERMDLVRTADETPSPIPTPLPASAADWRFRPWPDSLNQRERIPEGDLMPLEEIEEYLRQTLKLEDLNTQIIDTWWSKWVDADVDTTVPPQDERQERHISYTVTGSEAVRINELMVRAVRRVEAETVMVGMPDYDTNLDPAPYAGMPGFYVDRAFVRDPMIGDGWVRSDLDDAGGNPYDANAVRRIGPRTGWMTNTDLPDQTTILSTEAHPNLIEFQFRATEGLPPGRYYLTVNFTDAAGNMTLTDPLDLQYAVKYIDSAAGTDSIIGDVEHMARLSVDAAADLPEQFIGYAFENLGEYHGASASAIAAFMGRRPSGVTGVDGDLTGWVFIPGTKNFQTVTPPQAILDLPAEEQPDISTYFLDGLRPESQPYRFPGSGNLAYQTFTITIPDPDVDPYDTVCIAFRKAPGGPNPADPLSINFFDFSQEPDHEWVELTNVSDHVVDIAGWQLEIGIPSVPNGPEDPFRSLWTVDDANGPVRITPGGMVLLSFEDEDGAAVKYDQYREAPYDETDPLHTPLFKRTLLNTNGIGLCAGGGNPNDADTANDTPGIPDILNVSAPWMPGWGLYTPRTEDELYDPTGSVFDRIFDPADTEHLTYVDYVDRDGDGLSSYVYYLEGIADKDKAKLDTDQVDVDTLPATIALSSEYPPATNLELSWVPGGTSETRFGQRPWDRIVPMRNEQLWKNGANAMTVQQMKDEGFVGELARLVLQGGALPNYPEHDGFDNDGDGGYLLNGQYVPGTLDKDYVDNDLDGFIDEHPVVDENGTPADASDDTPPNPLMSEGVDEGRNLGLAWGRLYGAGSFEPGTLPLVFFNNQNEYPVEDDFIDFLNGATTPNPYLEEVLGGPSLAAGIWDVSGGEADDHSLIARMGNGAEDEDMASPIDINLDRLYTGLDDGANYPDDADPPEWKAFMERRWYPGDNVIVTLYAGTAAEAKVADRVTYRELDVTNRTVDDIAPCPYVDPVTGGLDTLHPEFPSLWPPDQMGLDFYRSLERKHPLYAGDRFGTQNRWQATDGNYDDWAESPSIFEHLVNLEHQDDNPDEALSNVYPVLTETTLDTGSFGPVISRFTNSPDIYEARLLQHCLNGSPLRMNLSQRRMEDPPDLLKLITPSIPDMHRWKAQFAALGELGEPGPASPVRTLNRDWSWRNAEHRDRAFQSAGDLMRFASPVLRQPMVNTALAATASEKVFLFDPTSVNISYYSPRDTSWYWRQDAAFQGGLLGQDDTNDANSQNILDVTQKMFASNPMILTVAQADFTPIRPNPNEPLAYIPGTVFTDLLKATSSSAPGAWAPVFLFQFENEENQTPPLNVELLPHYPSYPDGSNSGALVNFYCLFDWACLFKTGSPFGANDLPLATLPARWPLERRVSMYWSQHNPLLGDQNRPEALFTWDASDGVENGEYMVYVGTAPRELGDRLFEANAAAEAEPSLNQSLLTDFAQDVVLSMYDNPNLGLNSELAIEVITDPTKARGMAPQGSNGSKPGLAHPDDWMHSPMISGMGAVTAGAGDVGVYKPDSDGIIFYGNNAAGGWQPKMVQVTDNFLAIRVRNVGDDVSVITHVVLTPRKRTPGKINVNTAAMARVLRGESAGEMYNPLLTVPGVVDALATVRPYGASKPYIDRISPTDDLGLLGKPAPYSVESNPWPSPATVAELRVPPMTPLSNFEPTSPPDPLAVLPENPNDDQIRQQEKLSAFRLSALLLAGRREHADGRYYDNLSELVRDTSQFTYRYLDGISTGPLYPLSNEADPERRYEEVFERFSRMANTLTVRSDVFEIVATVQSGYGVDLDGDGWVNYRSNDEFVATAETKGRAVYERRAPSDRSEEPVD